MRSGSNCQMSLSQQGALTLESLNQVGFTIVEATITQLSSLRCQLLESIALPNHTRWICVIRNGRPLLDLEGVFLEEGDRAFLLTDEPQRVIDLLAL